MCAPWLSLGLLLLVGLPLAAESNESFFDLSEENRSDSIRLYSRQHDPLRDWIKNLDIPLPSNMSGEMPMGMGLFTIRSGYCSGLKLDDVLSEDLGSDLILEFRLQVSGLTIACFVDGYSDGPVRINITLEESALNATVRINPYISEWAEDLPLPLGSINMTECSAALAVTNMTWGGSGPLVETLGWVGEDVVGLVGMFVNEPLCEGLKQFLEVNGTAAMQQGAELASMLLLPPFPEPEPDALKPLLDWAEYPPVSVAKALIAERFGLVSNKVLDIINFKDFNSTLVAQDDVHLALSRLNVQGLGNENAPNVELKAHQSSLGFSGDWANMTLMSSLNLAVTLKGQPAFHQQIDVTLGLHQVALGFRAMVDEDKLNNLQLQDAFSSPQCLAQTSEGTTEPPEEAVAIEDFHVELRPLLKIGTPGDLATHGSHLFNIVVGSLLRAYLPTVNAIVNGALGLSRSQLDELIWKKIDASPACSREDMFFVLSEAGVLSIWTASVVLALLGVPVAVMAHFLWHARDAGRKQGSPPESQSTSKASTEQHDNSAPVEEVLSLSLACEPCVPRALAVYYPFALLAVMALFLYADLDVGTTVTMIMEADGSTSKLGPLFSFSLVSTVYHAWSSEAYFISVLTVIASGVWPFAKLSLLLIVWLVPPRCFSVWRRGKILSFLDTWGKFSLLDSWFLVLTLSAFALEWKGSGSASLKIQTTPAPAFYAFFAATVLSLVLGHVASESHRCAERRAATKLKTSEAKATDGMAPARAPLCSFAVSSGERIILLGALGASVMVAVLGTVLQSFSFEMSGLFPEFLFGDAVEKSYSLLSVGMSVASGRYNETGLIGLEVIFVLLAVLVPAILFGLLFALWLAPMGLERQQALLHACRLLDAWASLDVAAFVLAIACFEFARLAEWLIYEGNFAAPCRMVKDLTKDECMKIELHAYPALALLFIAGVGLIVVPKVTMRRCDRAIGKRSEGMDAKPSPKNAEQCEFDQL